MNPDIVEKLNESAEKLLDYVEQTGDFVVEQAPLVVQEMITWGITHCVFWIIIVSIVLLPIIAICGYFFRIGVKDDWDVDYCIPSGMVGGVSLIFWFLVIASNIYDLLYIYFAPRLFILDQLKGLIK